tara:strand:- start:1152 stop:1631 length:480 start_codon:yes stop_codon:yes gene_type:complete
MRNTDGQYPKNVILNVADQVITANTKTPVLPQFSAQAVGEISRLCSRDSLAQIGGYVPSDLRVYLFSVLRALSVSSIRQAKIALYFGKVVNSLTTRIHPIHNLVSEINILQILELTVHGLANVERLRPAGHLREPSQPRVQFVVNTEIDHSIHRATPLD